MTPKSTAYFFYTHPKVIRELFLLEGSLLRWVNDFFGTIHVILSYFRHSYPMADKKFKFFIAQIFHVFILRVPRPHYPLDKVSLVGGSAPKTFPVSPGIFQK